MTRKNRPMAEKNLDLIFEFERYVSEHPAFAKKILDEAILVFQVKRDTAFNQWSRRIGGNRPSRRDNPLYTSRSASWGLSALAFPH